MSDFGGRLSGHSFAAACRRNLSDASQLCCDVVHFASALVGSTFGSQGSGWRDALWRFVRSPLFLAMAAGLGARLIPWPTLLTGLPMVQVTGGLLLKCLSYLSLGTTPLILLSVGVALQPQAALRRPYMALLPCLLKLIVCPLAMWGACRLLGFHGELLRVGVLQAAMPTSVLASVLCAQNEMEGPLAVGVVFLTTSLSLVSLPLLLSWLH